jgi:acetyl-CoA carboxylase carboxyltransferase component
LNGQPVGVMANDPDWYAGSMTADGAQKVRRFVDLCDTFHLPLVSFVDEPGFMIGPEAEQTATIRHGTATLFAIMQSTVPWASVIVRKVYGVAGAAHFGPGGMVFAWPSAERGALPIEGGVALPTDEIAAAPIRSKASRWKINWPRSAPIRAGRKVQRARPDRPAAYASGVVRLARLDSAATP